MSLKNFPKMEITSAADFFKVLPENVNGEWLVGVETLFHFHITGEKGGLFSVDIREGIMEVRDTLNGEPKCVIQSKDVHFIKLLKGEMNPVMALLTGRLKVSNQEEIMKHARVLGLL